MAFLSRCNEANFVEDLPDDGEACADLFEVCSARETPTNAVTTGCLSAIYDGDKTEAAGFATTAHAAKRGSSANASASASNVSSKHRNRQGREGGSKKARKTSEVPLYLAPVNNDVVDVTTRSGRMTKRPNLARAHGLT